MEINIIDIVKLLKQSYGIDISAYDHSFLHKSLAGIRSGRSSMSVSDYYDQLKTDREEACLFSASLHIGYSEFFRNPLTFAILEQIILPQLWSNKKKSKETGLRIWSAACASGQESYSLAILLDEMSENLKEKPQISIFATDNDPEELEKAQKGIYAPCSLSKVTLKRIKNYFTQVGDNYEISTEVRKYVDFSHFDLLSDQRSCPVPSLYGNFDLVFCSNLLFYYNPESRRAIIDKISKTMSPGAFLVTGETEREILLKCNFQEVYENSAIFKKSVNKYYNGN